MAFLQLSSTNPEFSYLIKKNPASGLFARAMRKGTVFGYFSNEGQTYNVYFRDAFNDISYPEYKDQEFEYVNTTRYGSSQFVLNALSEVFRDAFKKRDEKLDPDGYVVTLVLNMIRMDNKRTLNAFTKHFIEDCEIVAEEVAHKHYRITLQTKKSLYHLLNLTNLFSALVVIRTATEYLPRDEQTVEKYFSSLFTIDSPYFIRYYFKSELLRSQRLFQKHKQLLETSARYPIEMVYGDTLVMRQSAIEKEISFSNHIVDVGCGEGRYVWHFNQRLLKGKQYYAIDIDEQCRNTVSRKVKFNKLTNVHVLESIDAFLALDLPDEPFDFILGEVIEHMSVDDATALVQKCRSFKNCNTVIVTTPNAEFNRFYFDSEDKELRHPDHKFEFTKDQFMVWVESICKEATTFDIGDKVNGIPVSLGVRFPAGEAKIKTGFPEFDPNIDTTLVLLGADKGGGKSKVPNTLSEPSLFDVLMATVQRLREKLKGILTW
jgi:2-polyprenyl-3-methyl-5-hydroxy-6-metoxy-1,4-benzoquinol methylase